MTIRTNVVVGSIIGLLGALVAAGCAAPIAAGSYARPGLVITGYRTFGWGPADALPVGDARLDRNPEFRDHFEGAVERELAKRGLMHAAQAPDLLFHYHASIDKRIDVNGTEVSSALCQGADCMPWVVEYEAGTIVLDVVDAKTGRLVWRGWARDSVEPMLSSDSAMARKVNEAVARMLATLPRP